MSRETQSSHISQEPLSRQECLELVATLKSQIHKAIFGQEDLIEETICAFLAGGHILITGAPGLAKTTLVRVFAQHLGLNFTRVQFTPDLLPSDIVGAEILNTDIESGHRAFQFIPGPVFTNLLLADEINRASPRTQSALLEAMQERYVTVNGKRHRLAPPFMVFATQNPFESEGTFPLPEAQLDRFLVHALVGYPDESAEQQILKEHAKGDLIGEQFTDTSLHASAIPAGVIQKLMTAARSISVDEIFIQAISHLVRSTRPSDSTCPEKIKPLLWYGAGPRAGIALISMAKSFAFTSGDETVRWKHIKRMIRPVLRHRIRITSQALREGFTEDRIISDLLGHFEENQKNLALGMG
jgi:MoxR-like ATPase